jgi:hypothetical protein
MDRFSDEPFGVRDIQFDCPQILVEACATADEIPDICGTRRFGGPSFDPAVASFGREYPFEASEMASTAADQDEERAALGLALANHRREISRGRSCAKDSRDF